MEAQKKARRGTPRPQPRHTNDSSIARLRLERGWTQQDLADRMGCKQTQIAKWETGVALPSAISLKKLSGALECSMDDLI